MTALQIAEELHDAADSFAEMGDLEVAPGRPTAMFAGHESAAIGAATALCFVRDLLTATPLETFSRDELLVMLSNICGSTEFFPAGIGIRLWEMECPSPEVEAPDERKAISDHNERAEATLERNRRRVRNKVFATYAVLLGLLAMGRIIWWCLQ
jgi:hypothetical protein